MYTFYKYINKPHDEDLVENGTILIRPLSEFRDSEKYGKKIGDPKEGIVRFLPRGKIFDTADPQHNKSLAEHIKSNIQAERIVIDAEQHIDIVTNNCFIFSSSQVVDKNVLTDLGYNSCVKISPFEMFFKVLTDNMVKDGIKVKEAVVEECIYQDKEFDLTQPLPKAVVFIKEKKFALQKEIRCAWIIENVEEKPLILTYPEIRTFCSIQNL